MTQWRLRELVQAPAQSLRQLSGLPGALPRAVMCWAFSPSLILGVLALNRDRAVFCEQFQREDA